MGVAITRLAAFAAATALAVAAPAGAALKGTDVSHWNGTIDWLQVANAGYSFAYVKATEGVTLTDPTYPISRSGAGTFGLRTGAYHFARPAGATDAARLASALAQADHFVDVAQPAPGDLPPALDLEADGGLSPAGLASWTQAFLTEVAQRTGATPALYFSPNFWHTRLADSIAFGGYPLWIAHWKVAAPSLPAAWSGWTFWQWTNCDAIPGFVRCADGDRFSGSTLAAVAVPASSRSAPAAADAPAVTGTPQVGSLLAASPGTWRGGRPLSFRYQWQSCDGAGAACAPLAGATQETYTPTAADAGRTLEVAVTAQGPGGSATALSPPTAALAGTGGPSTAAPVATAPPQVGGTAQVGQQLTVSTGTWTNGATSYAYTWLRCDATGAACTPIPSQAAPLYTLTPDDVGRTVEVQVAAANASGRGSASSPPTGVVAEADPVVVQSADGAFGASWQPGTVPPGAAVSLTPVAPRLALPGTGVRLDAQAAPATLRWPIGISWASPPPAYVVGILASGGVWHAVPELTTHALAGSQLTGYYVDGGDLRVLTRVRGTFALFAPGRWGDPRRVALGRPVVRPLTPLRVRRSGSAVLLAARVSVASQAHLYVSLGGRGRGQALVRAPGGFPIRVRLPARGLRHGTYRLRIAAVDPYGRRAQLQLPVRVQ